MSKKRQNSLYFSPETGLYLIQGKELDPVKYGVKDITRSFGGSLIKVTRDFVDFLVKRYLFNVLSLEPDKSNPNLCNNEEMNYYDQDKDGNYLVIGGKIDIKYSGLELKLEKNEAIIEATESFLDHIAQREINLSLKEARKNLNRTIKKYYNKGLDANNFRKYYGYK